MKLLALCASFLLATPLVLADSEYFEKPKPHAVFRQGSQVEFMLDKMSDDSDKVIYARLYRHKPKSPHMKRDDDDDDEDEDDDDDDDDNDDEDGGDSR